jgi:hypothetical protein
MESTFAIKTRFTEEELKEREERQEEERQRGREEWQQRQRVDTEKAKARQKEIEGFPQRREYLSRLITTKNEHYSDGPLRAELTETKEKLSQVTVDTPSEAVIALQCAEAALVLRLARGEAELERITSEMAQIESHKIQERQLQQVADQAEQKRIGAIHAQIAEIDALLNGTKPWPLLRPEMINGIPSDIGDAHRIRVDAAQRERAQLVAKLESPEEQAAGIQAA